MKTYSRARTAKAALAAILEMHETEGAIRTSEETPGRFSAHVEIDGEINELLNQDINNAGFTVWFNVPVDDSEEVAAMEKRAEAETAAATKGSTYIHEVSSFKGATKKVWAIADAMIEATRKEVIEECRRQGVAYGTARTQYQAWFAAKKN